MQRVLGKEHPATLTSINGLACALRSMGQYAAAAEMHLTALEARRRVLGEGHRDTLNSMSGLAIALYSAGRHDEAAKMYRKIIEATPRVPGKEHPGLCEQLLGFRVGSTVVIQGVLKKPELNSQTGTVPVSYTHLTLPTIYSV